MDEPEPTMSDYFTASSQKFSSYALRLRQFSNGVPNVSMLNPACPGVLGRPSVNGGCFLVSAG